MRIAIGLALALAIVAPARSQAPPPSAFPGVPPASPAADILLFEAEPADVGPGESTLLRWEAINAYALTITPDIGPVSTFGTERVTPAQTTTYTLTVTGAGGDVSRPVTVTVAGTEARTVPAGGSPDSIGDREIPRLSDGTPDLSGLFIGGRAIGLLADARLTADALAAEAESADSDLGQGALCLPPGVPNATMMPFPLQIVHKPDVLAIMYEAYHLFRIIPIGREQSEYLDPAWMGHSVAHWEGDTLVVDVRGFNDKTRIAGHRHTAAMRVTERYRRTDFATIHYEATVEDPGVFAEPVRYAGDLSLRPEWEIGEYVCNENNKDYDALFGPP